MESTFQHSLPFLFVQLAIILFVAPLAANVAKRFGQPAPVGWMAVGIVLGPSVFGLISPAWFQFVFQPAKAGLTSTVVGEALDIELALLSELGLCLLLFLMGVQFEFSHLAPGKGSLVSTLAIAVGGVACPFLLALAVSPTLYHLVGGGVPFWGFALFFAVAASVTALPILAFMMKAMGITETRLGTITITAAAVTDVMNWLSLAAITAAVKSAFSAWHMLAIFGWLLVYTAAMLFLVRPWLCRWLTCRLEHNNGRLSASEFGFLFVCMIISGYCTHWLGIYAIFGAFLMGAIISDVKGVRAEFERNLEVIVVSLFLPVFFTSTGLRTNIGSLNSAEGFLLLGVVLLVAIVGKFASCTGIARVCGFSVRESHCIGLMMNCRALMELVALNIGFTLGVVPPVMFTALVLMALITTVMTTPLLKRAAVGTELEEFVCCPHAAGASVGPMLPHQM